MNYVLILVQSSAMFLPTTFTMTRFEDRATCEAALMIAREQWQTKNMESKCIDIGQEIKIQEARRTLEAALKVK